VDNSSVVVSNISNPIDVNLNTDAFGRLRVSLPKTSYEYAFEYGVSGLIWDFLVTGLGTRTHIPTKSTVRHTTGIARTIAQVKLIGIGDDVNGVFFGQDDLGLFFLLRNNSDDSRKIYQSYWNKDKLDGLGSSAYTIDITRTQLFVCDIAWLGVSRIRVGFEHEGKTIICHEFYNSNLYEETYMGTANLPLRASIADTGNSIINQTFNYYRYRPGKSLLVMMSFNFYSKIINYFDQICATVICEGDGDQETYYQSSVSRGISEKAISTRQALISVRPKALFNGMINHGVIFQESTNMVISDAGVVFWQLCYNSVLDGVLTWIDAGTNSIAEYCINATTVSDLGEVVASGYLSGTTVNKSIYEVGAAVKYPIVNDISNLNPRTLTLVCTTLSGTSKLLASMNLRYYY